MARSTESVGTCRQTPAASASSRRVGLISNSPAAESITGDFFGGAQLGMGGSAWGEVESYQVGGTKILKGNSRTRVVSGHLPGATTLSPRTPAAESRRRRSRQA